MRSRSKRLCRGSLTGTGRSSERRWDGSALCGREEVLDLESETDEEEEDITSQVCYRNGRPVKKCKLFPCK